jgi:hypothetical protein
MSVDQVKGYPGNWFMKLIWKQPALVAASCFVVMMLMVKSLGDMGLAVSLAPSTW